MTDLDLTDLREIAEAATPGPWESVVSTYSSECSDYEGARIPGVAEDISDYYIGTVPPLDVDDAAHIAAFDPPTVLALIDRLEAAEAVHRDLTHRLGFGNGITEPMADNDTIVEAFDAAMMDQRDHYECPIVCELCGETLADKPCPHCHGSGANNALSQASLAYAECEWCAGAGKVHEVCVEKSYAELAADLEAAEAKVERVEAS